MSPRLVSFFGQNTVTGVSNHRSAITFRIGVTKPTEAPEGFLSPSKINSNDKYTVTGLQNHTSLL